ncbi:MAG: sugar ABC transporter substrate-binding protein [Myxococcota bacterium]
MKQYKTGIIITAVTLFLAGLIAGQTWLRYEATEGRSRNIVLWHSYIGKEAEALKKVIAQFNNDPQINSGFQIKILSVSFDNFSDKLTNSLPRGQGPDIFIYGHDRLEDWLSKEVLAPLDYWFSNKELKDFHPPKALKAFIHKKRIHGLPLTVKNLALFYRQLPDGSDPGSEITELQQQNRWNLKNFHRLATKYTRRCPWNESIKCYGLGYSAVAAYQHAFLLHGFGGNYIKKNQKIDLVTKPALKAVKFARKLAGHHDNAVVPPELSYSLMSNMFRKGEIAMVISGPWFMSQLNQNDFQFGVKPLPAIAGKPARPFLTVEGIYLSSKAHNPTASIKAIKYLIGKKSSLIRAQEAGQLPVRKSVIALMKQNCRNNKECIYQNNFFDVFAELSQKTVLMPASQEARILWSPYSKALKAVIERGKSPKTALEDAQWEIKKYLGACIRRENKQ